MMLKKTEKESICLLCSACCPVTVEIDSLGSVRPVYRRRDNVGICSRGGLVAALLADSRRLNTCSIMEGGTWKELALSDALGRLGQRLKGAGAAAGVVVDGNCSAEALLQAHNFCRQSLGSENFTIFTPVADAGIIAGVAASRAKLLSKQELAECDVVLCVGDPFATHPLVARPIHEAKGKSRDHRLVVVDVYPNRTSAFATDFINILPGSEHLLLAALARALKPRRELPTRLGSLSRRALLAATGITREQLEKLKEMVKAAARFAVVVSLPEGRNAYPELVGALAGMVSASQTGGILPLTIYGNARAAWQVASGVNARPLGALLKLAEHGKLQALLVVGTDLACAWPGQLADTVFKKVDFVGLAASMPVRMAAGVEMVLPLGMWFEEEGTAIDEEGRKHRILPIAHPPAGAVGIRELFDRLTKGVTGSKPRELDMKVLSEEPAVNLDDLLAPLEVGRGTEEGLVLVARPGCIHFADGSLTGRMPWPHEMEPAPVVGVAREDAARLGLAAGDCVKVVGNLGEVKAELELVDGLASGRVLLSAHFPGVRTLFDWSIDEKTGWLRAQPTPVRVEKES